MHLFRLRSRISEKVVLDGVHRQVPVSVLMPAETMKPARTGLREQSGSQSQGRSSCFPCAGAKDIGERLKGIMASSYELEPFWTGMSLRLFEPSCCLKYHPGARLSHSLPKSIAESNYGGCSLAANSRSCPERQRVAVGA